MLVGPSTSEGEESFDICVCSPEWLQQEHQPIIGRHLLIVNHFDWPSIEAFLELKVAECSGTSWDEVAEKVGRLGHWEFEDYRPARGELQ
jgi:hypothetical protein